MKIVIRFVLPCMVIVLVAANPAYALIDPGQIALLTAIAASAKETVGTLKNTMDLISVGDEVRQMLSGQEDDLDAVSELFEEVSPNGDLSPSERDSLESFKDYHDRISSLNQDVYQTDGVKWDAYYLKRRMDRMNPNRVSSLVRTATRAIRIGKKLAKLLPKSHDEQTAQNTEVLKEQNYAIGKAVMDIRSEVRNMNERESKNAVDGAIHTVNAIEQIQDDQEERGGMLK